MRILLFTWGPWTTQNQLGLLVGLETNSKPCFCDGPHQDSAELPQLAMLSAYCHILLLGEMFFFYMTPLCQKLEACTQCLLDPALCIFSPFAIIHCHCKCNGFPELWSPFSKSLNLSEGFCTLKHITLRIKNSIEKLLYICGSGWEIVLQDFNLTFPYL